MTDKSLISIEVTCWLVGLTLLGLFGGKVILDEFERQHDVRIFQERVALVSAASSSSANTSSAISAIHPSVELSDTSIQSNLLTANMKEPDQTLWSQSRKVAFANLPSTASTAVLGVLSIPSVDLTVPIYNGADDLNLDRGVARIQGTALPNQQGNSGIAGHRDGYFRVLKDVQVGEEIKVVGLEGEQTYAISEILIVDPTDVSVLDDTAASSLTLVTCYPFYFLGHAPKRFIVKAKLNQS